jgi:glutamate-1-semialdehyde 2,1-aminomutase
MPSRDYSKLIAELAEEYTAKCPRSREVNDLAVRYLVDGGSHNLRLAQPFPPRIVAARGAWIRDEDGHDILDFWQGHLANVLGHNPKIVTSELARAFSDGIGLQAGFVDRLQAEVAQILCERTGAERVRLTTSGTLADMYTVMLSRAFTGRDMVMKAGGGWHGAQPWSLKGFSYKADGGVGFQGLDSEGLPRAVTDNVVVTAYNDPQRLREDFAAYGDKLACFTVEPFIGAGGLLPASREYLQLARELTQKHGVVLIFDEVVNGFRFRAGNLGGVYGIAPDLGVYGKAIGGGMPVAAFGGRADIMNLMSREQGSRVTVFGGTYCGHTSSMIAAKTYMSYLVEHENEVYPKLADMGDKLRRAFIDGFGDEGIYTVTTGQCDELPCGSSLGMFHFPYQEGIILDTPEKVYDPAVTDTVLRTTVVGLALLIEDVHVVHGHGSASTANTDEDMEFLKEKCRKVAKRIKPYL